MVLEPGGIIAWLIVGLIAGWLTGKVMRGAGARSSPLKRTVRRRPTWEGDASRFSWAERFYATGRRTALPGRFVAASREPPAPLFGRPALRSVP
jgi:hypothetical protein